MPSSTDDKHNRSFVEQFVAQAQELLREAPWPPGVDRQEVAKQLRVIASGAFNRLDLVSRDEFDTQTVVLARTRQKVEALERQLEELTRAVADSAR